MGPEVTLLDGQAHAIESAAEAWKANSAQTRNAHFVERLIPYLTTTLDALNSVLRESWDALRASPLSYPAQQTGTNILNLFAAVGRSMDIVKDCLETAVNEGYKVSNADAFLHSQDRLAKMQAWFKRAWPYVTAEEFEASRARIAAGRSVTLGESPREPLEGNR